MKCKDCLKQDVCGFWYDWVNKLNNEPLVGCEFFKDKSKFLEVPCKIGDEIYDVSFEKDDIYNHIKIYHVQDISAKYIYFADDVLDHSELGESVFLNLDQARAKLRELEAEQ